MASPWDDEIIQPRQLARDAARAADFSKEYSRPTAWVEYMALRGTQRFLGALPPAIQNPIFSGIARLGRRVDGRHARAARDFLATAFPDEGEAEIERRVLAAYRHLARVAVESDRAHRVIGKRLADHFDVEMCPGLEEVVASKQGLLVLTAHVGFWEAVGLPFNALGYDHGVAVGKPPNNVYLARWIQRRREQQGGDLLPRSGAIQGVTAAVRSGGVAFLLLDQRARQKPIQVDFLGRPAACDRSAGVLVRRVRAPLVVTGCYLTDVPGRYKLVFQRVVPPEELAGATPEEVMALVNQESEALMRRAPDQYLWLHDRFRGMPAMKGRGA